MFKINDIVSFKSNPMFIGVVKNINIRKNSFLVETSIDSNWHNENEIELITNMYKTQSEVETELDIKLTESLSPPELTISKTETVTTDSTKFDIHRDICDTLNTLYRAKNADYGDSFANTRKVVSNAILVRLNDKISRLNSLMSGNKQQVKDESIKDTLMDLANYAILELVEMECEK